MGGPNNYFENFKPERVKIGRFVPQKEMARRIAHYLQIPQRFGRRMWYAIESLMYDALLHGEGIKIKGAGTLRLKRHQKDTHAGFGKIFERKRLYYFEFTPSKEGIEFLERISDEERSKK